MEILGKMKKTIFIKMALLAISAACVFSQEALKSIEEEYYDFLSLQGITNRPSLNYRTLSDSVWLFNVEENELETAEANETNELTDPAESSEAINTTEAIEIIAANAGETAATVEAFETAESTDAQTDESSEEGKNANQAAKKKKKRAKNTKSSSRPTLLHPWQNLNLGKTRALWQHKNPSQNFYMRGVKQGVFLKVYGPEWFNSFNTAAPYGQNDGALWQGKGYNTSLTTGVRLEGYGLEMTLKPQVSFSQNMEFDLVGPGVYGNEYSYFWKGNIDLPQRFGNKPYWTFDWGDTEIRYSWHTLTIGFGTQAIWLGPAWLNPMLGSNNSATYPKFDIGLRRQRIVIPKVNWYLGDIEGRIWLGQLSESNYFDNDSSNDKRQIAGFSAAFSPSFIPGFTIGFNKICMSRWDKFSLKYLNPFYSTNDQSNPEDQKMSVFFNWIFPKVGFEVYGELGKDDYSSQKTSNPFHTVIYTVGFKQAISLLKKYDIYFELIGEMNNFEMSQDFQLQWKYMGYYSHSGISQGYTQKGQIIGAGTGYFGTSEFLGLKMYWKRGSALFFYHRHSPDSNYVYNKAVDHSIPPDYDELQKYWARSKSYRTIGGVADFFITKGFVASAEFDVIWVNYPYYSKDNIGFMTYRVCLGMKYEI